MEEKHRDILRRNLYRICRDLNGRRATLFLSSEDIFSDQDRLELNSKKNNHLDLNEALVDMLERRGPDAFGVFMEFLKNEQVHLHELLESSLRGIVKISQCFDGSTFLQR